MKKIDLGEMKFIVLVLVIRLKFVFTKEYCLYFTLKRIIIDKTIIIKLFIDVSISKNKTKTETKFKKTFYFLFVFVFKRNDLLKQMMKNWIILFH